MKKLLTMVLASALLFTSSTFAVGAGGQPVNPLDSNHSSWFVYDLQPGDTTQDSIRVINNSATAKDLMVYPVDYVAASDGSFAMASYYSTQTAMGSWVTLETTRIQLAPNESVIIPFSLVVPSGVNPEDMKGAIAVQEVTETYNRRRRRSVIRLTTRMGVRIYASQEALASDGF